MLRFCKHRWLENLSVSERALKIWPYVITYVELVQKGHLPDPKIKSFEAIKSCCKDSLFVVKLMIFISIAREMTPFLTLYQTDRPMLPFLSEDMFNLMKGLMGRFCKEKSLKEANTVLKLLHFPLGDSRFHKEAHKINLGFSAEEALHKLKGTSQISERQALEIRMECKVFLITILKKLQEKAPVNHQLVRSMQCLDPRSMACSKEACLAKMKRILSHLVGANHIEESACDDILREYAEFCNFAALQSSFREFNSKVDRVDSLLFEMMGKDKAFCKVLVVLCDGLWLEQVWWMTRVVFIQSVVCSLCVVVFCGAQILVVLRSWWCSGPGGAQVLVVLRSWWCSGPHTAQSSSDRLSSAQTDRPGAEAELERDENEHCDGAFSFFPLRIRNVIVEQPV
ncbi:hypothetical protein WMY93_024578 [Mugilogobius chulae]|uniref:Uncharacterized protein n=1 Tax=Mugilogobius chulae TaxID=88201 RepID=A0AAW0N3D2_9GOBI